jgi:hypothetical protein
MRKTGRDVERVELARLEGAGLNRRRRVLARFPARVARPSLSSLLARGHFGDARRLPRGRRLERDSTLARLSEHVLRPAPNP